VFLMKDLGFNRTFLRTGDFSWSGNLIFLLILFMLKLVYYLLISKVLGSMGWGGRKSSTVQRNRLLPF
jgi:hypothetical protein